MYACKLFDNVNMNSKLQLLQVRNICFAAQRKYRHKAVYLVWSQYSKRVPSSFKHWIIVVVIEIKVFQTHPTEKHVNCILHVA